MLCMGSETSSEEEGTAAESVVISCRSGPVVRSVRVVDEVARAFLRGYVKSLRTFSTVLNRQAESSPTLKKNTKNES